MVDKGHGFVAISVAMEMHSVVEDVISEPPHYKRIIANCVLIGQTESSRSYRCPRAGIRAIEEVHIPNDLYLKLPGYCCVRV